MDTYAVVLYFDEYSNAAFNEIIKTIAVISNNNYMIDVNIPPHITIGSFFSEGHNSLLGMVENFAKSIATFDVKFDGIKAFEPRVLFASPIKDNYLEQLNSLIHEVMTGDFQSADNEYYTPAKWIPHCALAVRLDNEQFQKVKAVEEKIKLPMAAKVQKIALARCNPYKEIAVWEIN